MIGTFEIECRRRTLLRRWWAGIGNHARWERRARRLRMAWALVLGRLDAASHRDWYCLRSALCHHLGRFPLVTLDVETLRESVNQALEVARHGEDKAEIRLLEAITDDDIYDAAARVHDEENWANTACVAEERALDFAREYAGSRLAETDMVAEVVPS